MDKGKLLAHRSLLWIFVCALLISGAGLMGWLYHLHVREKKLHDDQYNIVALIQSAPGADSLKTAYLAELLDLSIDRPINLYRFDPLRGAKKLLKHPLIKEAVVQQIPPGTLYIRYQLRSPIAFVGDFTNTVIDEEGYVFPFSPFFTPKHLPTFYLGLEGEECKWGSCLQEHCGVQLALGLLCQFNALYREGLQLTHIDVSQADADSYGQRQVVIVLENEGLIYLRLNPETTAQNLMNFRALKNLLTEKMKNKGLKKEEGERKELTVIDLRIPRLAYVYTISGK